MEAPVTPFEQLSNDACGKFALLLSREDIDWSTSITRKTPTAWSKFIHLATAAVGDDAHASTVLYHLPRFKSMFVFDLKEPFDDGVRNLYWALQKRQAWDVIAKLLPRCVEFCVEFGKAADAVAYTLFISPIYPRDQGDCLHAYIQVLKGLPTTTTDDIEQENVELLTELSEETKREFSWLSKQHERVVTSLPAIST